MGEPDGFSPVPRGLECSAPQPCNQATMVCLRGPCQHAWLLTMRFDGADLGERVFVERFRSCIRHTEEMDLREQNVYDCAQWWPAPLAWVPVSARSLARPALRSAWEWWLRLRGYDFSWRWFKLDAFEEDGDMRRVSKPRFPTEEGK